MAVLAAVAVVLLPASPAWAHATLVSSEPAGGATLGTAPASVSLTFSERLNPDFTTIVVSDAARQRVPGAAPVIDGTNGALTLSKALGNGTYTVAYRIVSVDGHTVQGSFPFTVSDPALPPAAAVAVSPAPAAAAEGADPGIPAGVLIGIGAVGVALAGVAGYPFLDNRRRRRRRATASG
jgi:copper resistance protein C